ncbi:hypothetical protein DFH06DRAFT_1145382 [Mycena polygramma]|nr:hypothetical protein DFH06DRAFT_1145382 [Mycena polygramma]
MLAPARACWPDRHSAFLDGAQARPSMRKLDPGLGAELAFDTCLTGAVWCSCALQVLRNGLGRRSGRRSSTGRDLVLDVHTTPRLLHMHFSPSAWRRQMYTHGRRLLDENTDFGLASRVVQVRLRAAFFGVRARIRFSCAGARSSGCGTRLAGSWSPESPGRGADRFGSWAQYALCETGSLQLTVFFVSRIPIFSNCVQEKPMRRDADTKGEVAKVSGVGPGGVQWGTPGLETCDADAGRSETRCYFGASLLPCAVLFVGHSPAKNILDDPSLQNVVRGLKGVYRRNYSSGGNNAFDKGNTRFSSSSLLRTLSAWNK